MGEGGGGVIDGVDPGEVPSGDPQKLALLPRQQGRPVGGRLVGAAVEVGQDVEGVSVGLEHPGEGAAGPDHGHQGVDRVGTHVVRQVRVGGQQAVHPVARPPRHGGTGHGLSERRGQVAHVGNVTGTVGSVRGWTCCGWPCAR